MLDFSYNVSIPSAFGSGCELGSVCLPLHMTLIKAKASKHFDACYQLCRDRLVLCAFSWKEFPALEKIEGGQTIQCVPWHGCMR